MDGIWTPGEIAAVCGIALAVVAQFVTSLRFLYKMEARIDNLAGAVERIEDEIHGLREDVKEEVSRLATRAEGILVLQESHRHLSERVARLEDAKRV